MSESLSAHALITVYDRDFRVKSHRVLQGPLAGYIAVQNCCLNSERYIELRSNGSLSLGTRAHTWAAHLKVYNMRAFYEPPISRGF